MTKLKKTKQKKCDHSFIIKEFVAVFVSEELKYNQQMYKVTVAICPKCNYETSII